MLDSDINVMSISPANLIAKDTAIIFLHDALGSIEQWKTFPDRVASELGMKAYVYDRLGHGKSDPMHMVRDKNYLHVEAYIYLRGLVEILNSQKIILVGHSDGATISLLYASKFKNVEAVVAMSPHVFVEDITRRGIEDFAQKYEDKHLSKALERFHGSKTKTLFDAWHDTWLSRNFSDWNIQDQMSKIQCPVLLIQGLNDEYGTLQQIDSIASQLPQAPQQVLIPECAHFPYVTARKAVETSILEFIRTNMLVPN